MIKLIVLVMLMSNSSDGGVNVTVHESKFDSLRACQVAKTWFEQQGQGVSNVRFAEDRRGNKTVFISATCVEEK